MTARKKRLVVALLIALPIVAFFAALCIGRYTVSIENVVKSLWSAATGQPAGLDGETMAVVASLRFPRAVLAVLVGASLAASGAAFQSLFRNPLVSSGILGVSNGAGFGAALSILIFGGTMLAPEFAFLFGVVAVVLSYFVGRIRGTSPTITLVLGGTIVSSIFSALLSLTKYVADTESQLPAITFWLMGSLASTKDGDILYSGIPMVAGILGMLVMRWRLNVLSMGDREARTLGLNVTANKIAVIAFATLATAGAVSVSGVVGWIGLVIPHIGRMIVGNDNRWLVPASVSAGACFVLIVDTICRTLTGAEIPLGIVTAIVGGPFFVYLLKKTKGKNW